MRKEWEGNVVCNEQEVDVAYEEHNQVMVGKERI